MLEGRDGRLKVQLSEGQDFGKLHSWEFWGNLEAPSILMPHTSPTLPLPSTHTKHYLKDISLWEYQILTLLEVFKPKYQYRLIQASEITQ